MLQDLSYGRLENEFQNIAPRPDDFVICFQNHRILMKRDKDNTVSFPAFAEAETWAGDWQNWFAEGFRYVFRMQEKNYFLWLGDLEEKDYGPLSGWVYTINDERVNAGCGSYKVDIGDVIDWTYQKD